VPAVAGGPSMVLELPFDEREDKTPTIGRAAATTAGSRRERGGRRRGGLGGRFRSTVMIG